MKSKVVNSYEEIFNQRGYKYDQAMQAYPKARDQEFQNLVNRFQYATNTTVADVPAGGKYLKKYLPPHCHYVGFEPCNNFEENTSQNITQVSDFFPLPIQDHSIDITFSLAGLHHLIDKPKLFKEFKRITKVDGYLGIADVYQGSATALFLDNFVGKYNNMGHEGVYLSEQTLKQLNETGWNLIFAERIHLNWVFANKKDMGIFCQRLFDLTCSVDEIIHEIETKLGVIKSPANEVEMNWELYTIIASHC